MDDDAEDKQHKENMKVLKEIMCEVNGAVTFQTLLFLAKEVSEEIKKSSAGLFAAYNEAKQQAKEANYRLEPSLILSSRILDAVKEHIKTGKCEQDMVRAYEKLKEHCHEMDEHFSENTATNVTIHPETKIKWRGEEAYRRQARYSYQNLQILKGYINIAIAIRKKMEKLIKNPN